MRLRIHVGTYTDHGDGTFSVETSFWRGDPEREYRTTQTRTKPNAVPTADEVVGVFRAQYHLDDIAAESP